MSTTFYLFEEPIYLVEKNSNEFFHLYDIDHNLLGTVKEELLYFFRGEAIAHRSAGKDGPNISIFSNISLETNVISEYSKLTTLKEIRGKTL